MKPITNSQKGQNLIELAFVLPFLVVLALGLIDLSYALYMANVANRVSREGANLAARFPGWQIIDEQRHLVDIINSMVASAAPSIRDFSSDGCIIISVLKIDGTGPGATATLVKRARFDAWVQPTRIPVETPTTPSPPFSADRLSGVLNGQAVTNGESMAVVEVYYKHKLLTPLRNFIPGIPPPDPGQPAYIRISSTATFFLNAKAMPMLPER